MIGHIQDDHDPLLVLLEIQVNSGHLDPLDRRHQRDSPRTAREDRPRLTWLCQHHAVDEVIEDRPLRVVDRQGDRDPDLDDGVRVIDRQHLAFVVLVERNHGAIVQDEIPSPGFERARGVLAG